MKLIVGNRGTAKTVDLINMSEWKRAIIVCHDSNSVDALIASSKRLGKNIPKPISYSDFLKRGKETGLNYIVESVEDLLAYIGQGTIEAMSINIEGGL